MHGSMGKRFAWCIAEVQNHDNLHQVTAEVPSNQRVVFDGSMISSKYRGIVLDSLHKIIITNMEETLAVDRRCDSTWKMVTANDINIDMNGSFSRMSYTALESENGKKDVLAVQYVCTVCASQVRSSWIQGSTH